MKDLENAKKILNENGYTCVLCRESLEYSSTQRGVKPLLELLDSEKDLHGFSAADKTVGAGAAHLYVLLGVSTVWAKVMSKSGRDILQNNGITALCDNEVPYVINRRGDGMCPIETAVKDISSSEDALKAIRLTLKSLSQAR